MTVSIGKICSNVGCVLDIQWRMLCTMQPDTSICTTATTDFVFGFIIWVCRPHQWMCIACWRFARMWGSRDFFCAARPFGWFSWLVFLACWSIQCINSSRACNSISVDLSNQDCNLCCDVAVCWFASQLMVFFPPDRLFTSLTGGWIRLLLATSLLKHCIQRLL